MIKIKKVCFSTMQNGACHATLHVFYSPAHPRVTTETAA
ncbi:hypothetical protein Sesv_4352 [Salmonella enterica subsp. enterica serovar Virchow str. SVQ1]|uniref:Uncharacterized protein n=1 Tax=Salmonella virchow (strain SL491) TaxID=465517 RepID=A0A6C8F1W8_SALV4|nr:hypothetical protein SeV_B0165 [Salmonella enterica subsp. enterica serovar Virchow str. SL491]ETO86597.1 hypothetical protein Sesv_4352 [Salmonella enterica subsp. enterica serovar Virchow str. SVQ1]CEI40627.1 hypothetical protein SIN_00118 [Salmonella enterica subsp. enterica serovar Infantis]